jgi:hypothetical protein
MQCVWVARFAWRPCYMWRNSPTRAHAASLLRFVYHTQLGTHMHTVGLLRTSEQLVMKPLPTQLTKETNVCILSGNQTGNTNNSSAADLRPRVNGCRDRPVLYIYIYILFYCFYFIIWPPSIWNVCCYLLKTRLIVGSINITPIWLHLV